MTEQGKIPRPDQTAEPLEGGSLFERATRAFSLSGFTPPPVPDAIVARPRPAKPAARAPQPEPVREEPVAVAAPQASAEPVVVEVVRQPEPSPVAPVEKPVMFGGQKHAVDRDHLREQGMIVPDGPVTALLEEFRIVKRQLLGQAVSLAEQGAGAAAQRVLVCSPLPGEGKTFCAVNLALALAAEKEGEVVLVDADFAKPSVLSTLGIPGGPGLMDALTDPEVDVADCVLGTDIPGLWVLPAGNATNSDSEFLASSRTRAVLDRLTQGAPNRMVIFDSPPALAASPAAELATYVSQALLVARADHTGQGALEDAISLLSACPNIQLLLNGVSFSPSGRRFGS